MSDNGGRNDPLSGLTAPQLPIPGQDNSKLHEEQNVRLQAPNPMAPSAPSQKKGMDLYFDQALEKMGEHPVLTGLGTFFALYAFAGAYKSISSKMGGEKGAAAFLKGGFDPKMNQKEAMQILNLNEGQLNKKKLKEVHRRIMLANHPDKGGSPYLATKINEAKDFLEKKVLK
ncbi:probable Mitochondrial import inner membrane translocase subunit TIM14 [Zygosaccharomyces bailii]|uniref:Mitochondrial import inner membrane translocase subunit TIM14 n=1 Tax=Zygosaccharomyces bailii (strain CLIB 213 / ATCC 58445 / CBS 680 / BCRC 21525 / NBRC 1098 / NCYC 1416 / NRRL Y-2227) TaxID=1333698 RepID=A0A8J2X772_ZYGB2|nr:BN860_09076g1_1 [Zygosaccharomyces bailii CLIB 213]CDH14729.1 probable Mitochondrial import inner membrane translocase subunit TIM14 [Zygosaccharomyces bailii ISA1307]SJM82024.1 probable Mitochondrial import inner membrane translocase subunit TIM14 [Zygosaccharomyces bailii]